MSHDPTTLQKNKNKIATPPSPPSVRHIHPKGKVN